MNLQIRFADGTTEERDAESPCIYDIFNPVLKHPSEERWYLWFPYADPPLSFCGRNVRTLDEIRGGEAKVWRITNQDVTLIGEWQSAYVETREEQIERLTAERDAAHNAYVLRDTWALLWKGWAREFWQDARSNIAVLARLRTAAREAVDREMGNGHRYPENVKTTTLIAHLNTMDFGEARDLDALTNQAIEEGWFKVP